MSDRIRKSHPAAQREIVTPDGLVTVPPGSPKILIHTRQGKCVGVYCDHPAKVLEVETQGAPQLATDPKYLMFLSLICPQTNLKLVASYGTTVDHVLAMPLADPLMDSDLRRVLNAHEVALDEDWPDIW